MWIFTQKGFLSIVRHIHKPNVLIVRSRFKGHIERIFSKAIVEEDATRDYHFRAELPVREVSEAIAKIISDINYPNFKNSLDMDDEKYFESCIDVYSVVVNHSGNWDFSQFNYLKEEFNEG